MRRVVAAGSSDVGKVREGNEDALLIKNSVFAVADGMGGHLAGEVASATALEPIEALDGRVFPDATEAATALTNAVVAANATVSKLATDNPLYRGMGTTLTAALLEGRRVHVAHVGDSRAYLLRGGQFSQLTDDHTLVQHLVDEGQITREEAAHHPQRSIITRAIGVSPEVDVDSMTLDLQPGDQLLMCSDGLTGVVEDRVIAQLLDRTVDPDAAVDELVRLANQAGGPDNITVVLLRYEDPDAEMAAPRTISISTVNRDDGRDWAGQLGHYGALTAGSSAATNNSSDDEPRRVGRVLGRALAIVLSVAVLAGLVIGGGQFLLSRSFFVALDDDQVVIYQGVDASIGPVTLARVTERSELTLADIPSWYHPNLENGRTAADLNDARRIVRDIPVRSDEAQDSDVAGDAEDADADAPNARSA
jgi:PPM family protein phosphatase